MAISNNPNSPRQKMINLMYLVFIAMMAMNVSVEVLDGFELVEDSLKKTTSDATHRNELLMQELYDYYQMNEAKVEEWYRKGEDVKAQSDGLYDYIQELKVRIVQESDGLKGTLSNIKHKDDLEAASQVMLAPITGEGKKLHERMESYRDHMTALVDDTAKMNVIASMLSMEVPVKIGSIPRNWEATLFEHMPVAAAITLLTKLQSDVRYVEGEALSSLLNSIDVGAYRVNKIEAMVIPQSQIVMRGTPYRAQIVLAALDSTQQPRIFVGDRELPESEKGWYTGGSGALGLQTFTGRIELPRADGSTGVYPFSEAYSVTEPTATIAPTMMNVLYESIDNDIEVAIPGVPSSNVRAGISVGTMTQKSGNVWTARVPANTTEASITLTASMTAGGNPLSMTKAFRVRALPPATPYLLYKDAAGTTHKFLGGSISKRSLIEADGVKAAIDDGILDIPFTVTGFEVTFFDSMGNALPEISQGSAFTQRQKDMIRNLARGKRFYITSIRANDPGGKSQKLATIEVIVN
ncbi:MAG: gliding motility protein GldM [Tannerella sp.]|jgi:gliding motility-associated protein GldM|nr:gliding motility protein GldM [Tannerella sp.]